MTLENQKASSPTAAQALLERVREVARELHVGRSPAAITLDSSLEREAGIDSLGRMELLARIERHFGVALPEAVVFAAETPRDVLHALETARPASFAPPVPAISTPALLGPMPGAPAQASTIPDLLDWHIEHHAEHPYIQLYAEDHSIDGMTYGDVVHGATRVAAGLQADGLHPGQTVALMLPTGRDYFYGFYGILLAGGIPVPIYPPHRRTQMEDHLRRQISILSNAQAHWLITWPEAKRLAALLKSLLPELHDLVTVAELSARGGPLERIKSRSQDIAFLQYTSGSTGDPKGVVLTHENLLANLRAMGAVVQASASDCFVSWLPLYHDMGLIGAGLGSLYYGMPLVLMSPLAFLARPQRWLWAIHQHRGTLSAAPNFAYEICARRIPESELTGLDLSSWRVAFNGAEPVSPDTLAHFMERFRAYGFRPEAMMPVYGLAESSVGLAFPPLHRGPRIDSIQRETFLRQGRARPAAGDDKNALRLVACGQPLPGHEIRIVDEADHELGERENGHLQFRGPSATSGYYRHSRATQALFHDSWLDSGDLAYLADGEVYITGREKDLMIRAGRNLFPYELEQAIGDIPGIRRGCVAVFGSPDPASGTERVIILAETKETQPEKQAALRQQIVARATDLLDMPPDQIILVPPHTVLKTSSGKIRHAACRELYERGALGRRRAVWWQLTRLALLGIRPRLRRIGRRWAEVLYGLYVWALFILLLPPAWLGVMLLPRQSWRATLARVAARGLLFLTQTPVRVEGLDHIPQGQSCVAVANHTSYLDAIVLTAILPTAFCFVAKGEFRKNMWLRWPLQRLGHLFVERFDPKRALADTGPVTRAVRQGRSVVFFPEGTFGRAPGLRAFHMGAFMVAAQAGAPIIPVALRGTRVLLRNGQWLPRPGVIRLIVGPPITPRETGWDEARRLRDRARAHILPHCGEPDRMEEI